VKEELAGLSLADEGRLKTAWEGVTRTISAIDFANTVGVGLSIASMVM
jgi:hypothetical protein